MQVEPAAVDDLPVILALVVGARLPVAGLEDQFPFAYAVAREAQGVVGVAGLQPHGRFGLLRSVAVAERSRGAGIGRALVSDRLAAARTAGLDGVYLLTTGAADWFHRLGFVQVARDSAPPELLASPEFLDACPASAACMLARPTSTQIFSPSPASFCPLRRLVSRSDDEHDEPSQAVHVISPEARGAWRELEARLRPYVARRLAAAADVDDVVPGSRPRRMRRVVRLAGARPDPPDVRRMLRNLRGCARPRRRLHASTARGNTRRLSGFGAVLGHAP